MPYYVGHDDYFSNLWPIYLCLALSRLFFKSITYLIASCLTTTNFQIYDRFICVLPYHDYFSYLWPIYLRLALPLLFFKSMTYLFGSCLTTTIFQIYDLFICTLSYASQWGQSRASRFFFVANQVLPKYFSRRKVHVNLWLHVISAQVNLPRFCKPMIARNITTAIQPILRPVFFLYGDLGFRPIHSAR